MHLIIVRDDLESMIHRHPPVAADGSIRQKIVLPGPGHYRVVVDAYPARAAAELPALLDDRRGRSRHGKGAVRRSAGPPRSTGTASRWRDRRNLKAIEAGSSTINVTDPQGRPARFTPWYGALAHAIFFRAHTLDYFHTHVCAPGMSGCTSSLGATQVKGSSTTRESFASACSSPSQGRGACSCRPAQTGVCSPFPSPWRSSETSVTTLVAVVSALAYAATAYAHAHVSPSVVPAEDSQVFTLAVPTEKEDATTTKVELTPPDGFSIDSFIPTAVGRATFSRPARARTP